MKILINDRWMVEILKNVSCEYDRWVVETQLCELRDTSDTFSLGALVLFSIYNNIVFVNYIYLRYGC